MSNFDYIDGVLHPDPEDVVVIYHGPCNDGFTAAWAAWKLFGDEAEYYQTNYNKEVISLNKIKNKHVYILDFSYPRNVLEKIKSKAASLVILDHHKSAQKELQDFPGAIFDLERSGAGLAWDYFHDGADRPKIIDYAEDYDLWQFKYANTKSVVAVMEHERKDFENWSYLSKCLDGDSLWDVVQKGDTLLEYKNFLVKQKLTNKPAHVIIDNNIVPIVNTPIFQNEVANELAKNRDDFAAAFYINKQGKYVVSLRSSAKSGFDVSLVAKKYGGGGHKNAAGFTTDGLDFIDMEEVM